MANGCRVYPADSRKHFRSTFGHGDRANGHDHQDAADRSSRGSGRSDHGIAIRTGVREDDAGRCRNVRDGNLISGRDLAVSGVRFRYPMLFLGAGSRHARAGNPLPSHSAREYGVTSKRSFEVQFGGWFRGKIGGLTIGRSGIHDRERRHAQAGRTGQKLNARSCLRLIPSGFRLQAGIITAPSSCC